MLFSARWLWGLETLTAFILSSIDLLPMKDHFEQHQNLLLLRALHLEKGSAELKIEVSTEENSLAVQSRVQD